MVRVRRPAAPWLTAGVLAAVALGLLLTLLLAVRPARADQNSAATAGTAVFSTAEQQALRAAKVELVNLLSYTRKNFDADYARALAGATGQLRSDLTGSKDATLKTLTDGKFDLSAEVTNAAVVGPADGGGIQILLVARGYRTDDSGARSLAVPSRIQLTMVKSGGAWLANDLQGVYLQ